MQNHMVHSHQYSKGALGVQLTTHQWFTIRL